ncbi:TIGR03862 family flavoprotein [Coralloluteibacterium thermophilus]|uniref:TIGR03862 family flavoprotein n=1 Tax=Coralloluteibacterium thermophilum TaxID=2707049 RepID=A0ABV9NL10_9GAMM
MPADAVHAPGAVVVGGGPAGLMAAEVLRAAGIEVDLYEAKGSVGRKFLIAGKGGLNLTHSDPFGTFVGRYRERADAVADWLRDFDADALRAWARGLGVETYVGSSGRVFPLDRKAAPLLRGWVRRLKDSGVRIHVNHRWRGWSEDGLLCFDTPDGSRRVRAEATLLALGGGSWPQLGSDGAWQALLRAQGVEVAPLAPANCGFDVGWSAHLAERHAGAPLKPVVAHWLGADGTERALQGECVLTATGIEGSLVYAIGADLRAAIAREGEAVLHLDLAPGRPLARLATALSQPRRGRSLGEHLRRHTGLDGAKLALVHESIDRARPPEPDALAALVKRLPLRLRAPRPLPEAISSAGGVRLEATTAGLELRTLPGVFCAGEMLDWEAPTGGYLLAACFASGRHAGLAMARRLQRGAP